MSTATRNELFDKLLGLNIKNTSAGSGGSSGSSSSNNTTGGTSDQNSQPVNNEDFRPTAAGTFGSTSGNQNADSKMLDPGEKNQQTSTKAASSDNVQQTIDRLMQLVPGDVPREQVDALVKSAVLGLPASSVDGAIRSAVANAAGISVDELRSRELIQDMRDKLKGVFVGTTEVATVSGSDYNSLLPNISANLNGGRDLDAGRTA
ncbi:MAG: hypothetical protein SFW63_07150 [Alphaproteobacteria bacterium]|nr:hypothetical protein [Alphaproteobacteria bacterium]